MARKGILSSSLPPKPEGTAQPRARLMPQGAVGALQSSLTKLQENAVQDIDATLIDDAGFEDRLGPDSTADSALKESLSTYGQQVPVLLRPHPTAKGRYEIVYGRRRLAALRALNMPVKAMIRQLDDHALAMAQGQENNARQDLTFIEKASFAAQLQRADYDRPTIAAALAIDLPMVSRMLKVGTAFDLPFLRQIGRAPSVGRERWMQLADLMTDQAARSRVSLFLNRPEFVELTSDARFDAILARALNRAAPKPEPVAKPRKATLTAKDGRALGTIKSTGQAVTLSVNDKNAAGFSAWLEENAAELMQDWHARWQAEQGE